MKKSFSNARRVLSFVLVLMMIVGVVSTGFTANAATTDTLGITKDNVQLDISANGSQITNGSKITIPQGELVELGIDCSTINGEIPKDLTVKSTGAVTVSNGADASCYYLEATNTGSASVTVSLFGETVEFTVDVAQADGFQFHVGSSTGEVIEFLLYIEMGDTLSLYPSGSVARYEVEGDDGISVTTATGTNPITVTATEVGALKNVIAYDSEDNVLSEFDLYVIDKTGPLFVDIIDTVFFDIVTEIMLEKKVASIELIADASVITGQTTYEWTVEPAGIVQIDSSTSKKAKITPLELGEATVTVTVNGISSSVKITVVRPTAQSIEVFGPTKIQAGTQGQLTANLYPEGSVADVEWEIISPEDTTATVSDTGLVVVPADVEGEIIVRAIIAGSDVSIEYTIEIVKEQVMLPEQISIEGPTTVTLGSDTPYDPITFKAILTPEDSADKSVTWSIIDGSEFATIDAISGNLTTLAAGTVVIEATSNAVSTLKETHTVTIEEIIVPNNISIEGPATAMVGVDATIELTATVTPENAADKSVTWSILSGDEFATIDQDTGILTILDEGTVVVEATSNAVSTLKTTHTVTITKESATEDIIITTRLNSALAIKNNTDLIDVDKDKPGTTAFTLNTHTMIPVRFLESFGAEVIYESYDKPITVNYNGKQMVINFGAPTFTVTEDGKTETFEFDTMPPTLVDSKTYVPYRKACESLGIFVEYDNATYTIVASTKDITSAQLSEQIALAVEKFDVYVNGVQDIKALKATVEIKVGSENAIYLNDNYVQLIGRNDLPPAVTKVIYSSSNPEVATVNAQGRLVGVKAGTTIITLKSHNYKETTITVTVK